jgi:2-polyprenyl-6-methoxyphenol hydroxylase-like FAD-dependent oxidoreductase
MRVAVCGAGIAGLALARRLATSGHEVVVLEKAPGPRTQGYMIDFFGPGYEAVDRMGLLPRVLDAGYDVREAAWFDDRGRRRTRVAYTTFERAVGGRLTSIMRPDLERVLRESLPEDVELRFGARLTGVDDQGDRVRLTLADGGGVEADLLVGADGIHSTVRALTFGGERDHLRYLGFHTAAWVFDAPGVASDIRGTFALTDTIDRQMGFYELRDGRIATFAVHRAADPAQPDDVRATVRRIYGDMGWLVPLALEACPPVEDIYYDQVAQTVVPQWSRGRVVLLGDSCYAVSLLAGQGASLAIAGAHVLADQLDRAETTREALARYEELWRPIAAEKQLAGRRGARWFLPHSGWELAVRRATMRASNLPGARLLLGGVLAGKPVVLPH